MTIINNHSCWIDLYGHIQHIVDCVRGGLIDVCDLRIVHWCFCGILQSPGLKSLLYKAGVADHQFSFFSQTLLHSLLSSQELN